MYNNFCVIERMHTPMTTPFHLPTKPYDIVDAINRICAATGSVHRAVSASNADYNGHALRLYWNDYRGYYVGEYFWGERVVLVRTTNLSDAITKMKQEFDRQGRGSSFVVHPKEGDEQIARDHNLIEGEPVLCDWYTWKHKLVGSAVRLRTDHLLIAARDEAHYDRLCGWETVTTKFPNGTESAGKRYNADLAKIEQAAIKSLCK